MLYANRKSNGQPALAHSESKSAGPFICPQCNGEVVLRTGTVRVNHFSHKTPNDCPYGTGESDDHRRCKLEIFKALTKAPGVTDVAMERSFQSNRPDVFACINGTPVAIEVQISALSLETIIRRTAEYARQGIYVLWLPQWTPYLDSVRYSPRLWERWIHAAYFGRVYYWHEGLTVASYHFDPYPMHVPKTTWNNNHGKKMSAGGYTRNSKRFRSTLRDATLNLATDFAPRTREPWKGSGFEIPSATLYMQQHSKVRATKSTAYI